MKKSRKILSILLCLVAVLSFTVGCSKTNAEDKVIKVGATQVPGGDLFEYLKDDIKKEGYDLEITIFDDYNLPNEALDNGEIDANLFQHKPYLDKAISEKGYKLSPVVGLYESPLYVYSYKIKSIDDLKAGDKFALPDDPTNGSRALKYLQENGINGTYWSAGPRWGDYPLSVQPTNNYTQDRPQLSTLLKYKSTQQ